MVEFGPNIFERLRASERARLLQLGKAREAHKQHLSTSTDRADSPTAAFKLIQLIPVQLRRPIWTIATLGGAALVSAAPVCADNKNSSEGEKQVNADTSADTGPDLPWQDDNYWFLTSGPHGPNKNALDFAPDKVVTCPAEAVADRFVTTIASGKVIEVGDENDPGDKYHSIVLIEVEGGFRVGYMHLANMKVKKGQIVEKGQILGSPSCQSPPGGHTDGAHVHLYLEVKIEDFVLPVPIEHLKLSGWEIHEGNKDYEGTMTKYPLDVRTAEKGRCGPSVESINRCGGIRNDLKTSETLGEVVTRPAKTPAAETFNRQEGVVDLGNWQFSVNSWREIAAIDFGFVPKEGWKRVLITGRILNKSSNVVNPEDDLIYGTGQRFKFSIVSNGFEYEAGIGDPKINPNTDFHLRNIVNLPIPPGFSVQFGILAEVPQSYNDYELKVANGNSDSAAQIINRGEEAPSTPIFEKSVQVKDSAEAWQILGFATIHFNRIFTTSAQAIGNGTFDEQYVSFNIQNNYGQEIKTRYLTELVLLVFLSDGRVIGGSEYHYSQQISNPETIAPGLNRTKDIIIGNDALVGQGLGGLYDTRGGVVVLIYRDRESTNRIGTRWAVWRVGENHPASPESLSPPNH